MATEEEDLYRRHVQQKFVERFTEGTSESGNSDGPKTESAPKSTPYCFQNFVWLSVAIGVFYFSDFLTVVTQDLRIRSIWFWIGVVCMSVHVSIAAFVVLWLNLWKKVNSDDWDKKYPKAIPLATASFIIGIICMSVGLWPVWGFYTPFILLSLGMGIVVLVAMIG